MKLPAKGFPGSSKSDGFNSFPFFSMFHYASVILPPIADIADIADMMIFDDSPILAHFLGDLSQDGEVKRLR